MNPFTLLDRARDHHLSETGVRLLFEVANGATSQTEIANKRGVSRAAINQAVKSLVTRELMYKHRASTNERNVILALTQSGKDMIARLTAETPASQPTA